MMVLIRKLFGLAEHRHDPRLETIRERAGDVVRVSAEIDKKLKKFQTEDDPLAALVADIRRKNLNGRGH